LQLGNMPIRLKRNAVVVFGLAALLVFAKYNLTLLMMTPLGQDPCDAVGVFAFTIVVLIPLVSLVRAFGPYRKGSASAAQCLHVIRSQQAVVLAVFITLAADTVALARHPSMWVSAGSHNKLLAWLGIFAAVALAGQLLTLVEQRTLPRVGPTRWKRAALAPALAILLLVFCPEWPSDNSSTTAHILTVVLGALVVFVPMRFLLPVLVPYKSDEVHSDAALFSTASEWCALLVGILMGAFGFWADTHKWAGALRYVRHVLAIAPLLLAYAFLGEPLGFVPRGARLSDR
jgi:hypothetical protein